MNVKGLGEAVPKVMGGTGLEGLPVVHHALNGIGPLRPGELLLLRLHPPDHRHGQVLLAEAGVAFQLVLGLLNGLLGSGVEGVALLPQKLPVAQEGAAGLLPPQDAAPLIVLHRQIPPGVNDILKVVAKQGLGGGPDAQLLLQLLRSAHGDPGALGGEALHMVLLLLQQALRNEDRHIHILMAGLLKHPVQNRLDVLPDGVAIGPVNEHALHAGIGNELRLLAHVCVPLGKVYLHIGDLLHFLLFCHPIFILSRGIW